jgi:hypothetical protein
MMVKISGSRLVEHRPEELWSLLTETRALHESIPGCQSLETTGDHRYDVVLRVSHGLVHGKFHGKVALEDMVEPESCRLDLHANGFTGSLEGSAAVRLRRKDDGSATEISFEGNARVGGLLRALGPHTLESVAHWFVDRFLEGLSRHCRGGA